MHYPTTVSNMNQALLDLGKESPHVGLADISYRGHYEVQRLGIDSASVESDIPNHNTSLLVCCPRHEHEFVTTGRKLFSVWKKKAV